MFFVLNQVQASKFDTVLVEQLLDEGEDSFHSAAWSSRSQSYRGMESVIVYSILRVLSRVACKNMRWSPIVVQSLEDGSL